MTHLGGDQAHALSANEQNDRDQFNEKSGRPVCGRNGRNH